MATVLRSDRTEVFGEAPAVVWARLADVRRYPERWPMIRRFEAHALEEGDRWRCSFRSPLGVLHVALEVGEVVPGRSVAARVEGDIEGEAAIVLAGHGDGTRLRLTSELVGRRRLLRTASAAAPPLARWSHDRVISRGLDLLHVDL